ncbi:MAG: B-box zinc finger protein [Sedimenticola sp.]
MSCASAHSSLKISRDHVCTSVTGSDLPSSEESGKRKHALSYCSKHGDIEIEWFCEKDEAMFCDTCKRLTHRKCQVMSVSDMKSSAHGQSLDDVINSLLSLKCRIAELKSEREKSAEDLVNFKTSCKDAVQQFKSSIIEKLDRLEKEIMADVDKVVSTETAAIQDHVQTCDSLIPQVEAELTTADGAKTAADDVASVVAAYELDKTLKMLEPTVSDLELEACQVHITFQPSSKLVDMISGVDQLGMLEINRTEKVDAIRQCLLLAVPTLCLAVPALCLDVNQSPTLKLYRRLN